MLYCTTCTSVKHKFSNYQQKLSFWSNNKNKLYTAAAFLNCAIIRLTNDGIFMLIISGIQIRHHLVLPEKCTHLWKFISCELTDGKIPNCNPR